MSLELEIKSLSHKPGIYQFIGDNEEILYIGKAKNLFKRVSSYFNKNNLNGKTRLLVSKIKKVRVTVVETEFDALLLENNLIKEYRPKYNINLKDDKTYPSICIKNEHFPRVFLTRRINKDGSEYFGPFASVLIAKNLLELIKSIYPLRTCSLDLMPKKIQQHKYSVCLEYHIHNCLGPCEGLQSEEDYNGNIQEIREIIKGNFIKPLNSLRNQMNEYAKKMEYEKAHFIKEKIQLLEKYQVKSTIVSTLISDVDVFSIISDEISAYVNYLKIINGRIIQSYTTEIKKQLEESEEEILERVIFIIREKFNSNSKEIFLPFPIDFQLPTIKISVPKIGDKKKLVELSEKNAKEYRIEKLKQIKIIDPNKHTNRIMAEMKNLLHLPEEPRLIEGFDNSNIQGTHPVSACVVFRNGKPSKSEYRIFNVKSVEGPNDFATMEEVVYRRYRRQLEEGNELPQLILIDGGKGQLSAACQSLKLLGLDGKIPIIGIAKKLEELFYPHDPIPLYLDKTSETLKILQYVRNESHRYGINNHRNRRGKTAIQSELDSIKGIGNKTKISLLKKFKSIHNIREASEDELIGLVGKSKTSIIREYFRREHN